MNSKLLALAAFGAVALAAMPALALDSTLKTPEPGSNQLSTEQTLGTPTPGEAADEAADEMQDADMGAYEYTVSPIGDGIYIKFEPMLSFDQEAFAEDMDHAEDALPAGKAARYYLNLRGVVDASMNAAFRLAGMFREENVVIYVDETTRDGGADVARMIYRGNPDTLIVGNSSDEAFADVPMIGANLGHCGEEIPCLIKDTPSYLALTEQLKLAVALHQKAAAKGAAVASIVPTAPALAKN